MMSTEQYFNGEFCKIYKGTFAAKTDIVGQGDASTTHNGAPIVISNKSTGGYRKLLTGSISEKSMDISVTFSTNDDATYSALVADATNATSSTYCFVFASDAANSKGYYYEGQFVPVIQSEAAAKGAAATTTVLFMSHEAYARETISAE